MFLYSVYKVFSTRKL